MPANAAITALTAGGDLRTWSLIVTIFGDMARAPGAEIPGPALTAIAARVGVKPEATRVALHRLRKDGWIASRRAGRGALYFLTETGRAQSEAATARIFARHASAPDIWHVVVSGPLETGARVALDTEMAGYVGLAPGVWLGRGAAPDVLPAGLFALDGANLRLPDWLRTSLMPRALADAYADFRDTLVLVDNLLPARSGDLPSVDRAAIRILIVHGWRRLVLRHADLPDRFFPDRWQGTEARALVHRLLDRLGPASLADITEEAAA